MTCEEIDIVDLNNLVHRVVLRLVENLVNKPEYEVEMLDVIYKFLNILQRERGKRGEETKEMSEDEKKYIVLFGKYYL